MVCKKEMHPLSTDRREFIKMMSFAGGSLAFGDMGAIFSFKDKKTVDALHHTLKAAIRGKIVQDNVLIEEYKTDFGRTLRKEPRIIIEPHDDADIVKIFGIATEQQIPVAFRGAGHSCYGQSLSDGGILLVNRSESAESSFENGQVTVPTRQLWYALEQQLNAQNLTSPVLTDYLSLTVGGTLSVGGYGLRSFNHGAQVDNVDELELILMDGRKVRCSQKENRDLFRFSLSGLGQLGFIDKVKYTPIPFKQYTSVFYILSENIKAFIENMNKILAPDFIKEIDHFSSYWLYGKFIIEIGKSFVEKDAAQLERLKKKVGARVSYYRNSVIKDYHFYLHEVRNSWVGMYGISHHIWEDYIFGIEELEEFLEFAITTQKLAKFQNILPALYIVACDMSQTDGIPFSPAYGSNEEMVYSVGFYYMVKYGKTKLLKTAQEHHRQFMKRCLELDGRPYLYGWHGLNEDQKNQLYGKDYQKLKELKKQYDPANLVNPGKFVEFSA